MMRMKEEIEKSLDDLIEDAQKLVDETKIENEREKREKPVWEEVEETQMRNILDMSISIDSIKALVVYIEYQMGRGKIPRKFGEKIIEKIHQDLRKRAEEISKKTGEEYKKVWIEIIRQYLGYLNRYFIYRAKMSGSERA
jgi:vacuolar-type H+-ATPase subunit E/Vma4